MLGSGLNTQFRITIQSKCVVIRIYHAAVVFATKFQIMLPNKLHNIYYKEYEFPKYYLPSLSSNKTNL